MYAWLLLLQFKLQPYRLYLFIIYTTAPPDWFLIMSRLSLLLVVVLVAVSSAFVPHGAVPRSALSSSVAPAFAPRADPLFAESEDMTWEGEYPPSKVLGPIMSKMPSGLLGMLSLCFAGACVWGCAGSAVLQQDAGALASGSWVKWYYVLGSLMGPLAWGTHVASWIQRQNGK